MLRQLIDHLGTSLMGSDRYRRRQYKRAKRIARRYGYEVYLSHLIWQVDEDYIAAKRPVTILPLAPKPKPLAHRPAGDLRRGASGRGLWSRFCREAIGGGCITPPHDLGVMHRQMVKGELARLFADGLNKASSPAHASDEQLADRTLRLLGCVPGAAR